MMNLSLQGGIGMGLGLGLGLSPQQRFYHTPNKFQTNYQNKPNFFHNNNQLNNQIRQQSHDRSAAQAIEFDGKRLRKAVARKTVDYNSSVVKYLETRTWQRDYRDRRAVQPDFGYYSEIEPPMSLLDNPVNAITTKFVRTSTNKMRCPIFCVVWTPEGRRLITGASSGEFTLWNGLTFNFETILQAHDSPVRCMVWSHNDVWMVTGDQAGYVKYWQSNMNNVKMFQAHKEPLRGISFCPTDTKFVTCADDGTVRIWDFLRCQEEKILRGHGADVKCVDWHPQKSLIVSGSKDSQQPIKLWDPKSGQGLATIHAHKGTVMEVKWNQNGTWLLTASRDHLLKLFDIRNMSQEVQTFRGHKKEACSIAWHPIHEPLFVSGGSEGSVMFWVVGNEKEVGSMEQAHDSCVWSLAWHPLGHILCTGSNDHTSKFWTRNRPGDRMRDKYNLNTMPKGQDETAEYDEPSSTSAIPGMGMDYGTQEHGQVTADADGEDGLAIPGLDFSVEEVMQADKLHNQQQQQQRKMPFSKPIPRQFQQQWLENKQPLLLAPPPAPEPVHVVNESNGIQNAPVGDNAFPGPPHPGGPMNMAPPSIQPPSSREYSPSKRMPFGPSHSQDFGGQGAEGQAPHRPSLLGDHPAVFLPPPDNRLRPENVQQEVQVFHHDTDDRDIHGAMIGDTDDRSIPQFNMPGFAGDGNNNAPHEQPWQQQFRDRDLRVGADSDLRIGRPGGLLLQPNEEQQRQTQPPFTGDGDNYQPDGFNNDFDERFAPSIRGRMKSSYVQSGPSVGVAPVNSFSNENSFENFQPNNDLFGNPPDMELHPMNESDNNLNPTNEMGGFQGGRKRPWAEPSNDNGGFFQQHQSNRGRGGGGFQQQGTGRGGRGGRGGGRGRNFRGRGRANRGGGGF